MSIQPKGRRVWDLPTRLFHWMLVGSVVGALITVQIGGNAMVWHGRLGQLVLALMLFRLAWGVVGGRHARFADFVPRPSSLLAYLRGRWSGHGHSPLGALSVMALIGAFLLQASLGLATTDDIFFDGPLVRHLPSEWVSLATSLHHAMKPVLLALVGLHLAALTVYRLKGQKLVGAMVTGHRPAEEGGAGSEPADVNGSLRLAAVILALSLAAVFWGLPALAEALH